MRKKRIGPVPPPAPLRFHVMSWLSLLGAVPRFGFPLNTAVDGREALSPNAPGPRIDDGQPYRSAVEGSPEERSIASVNFVPAGSAPPVLLRYAAQSTLPVELLPASATAGRSI